MITRMLFVSFASALVLFGVVLSINIAGSSAKNPPTGFVTAMVIVGAVVSVAGRALERPLDCTSDVTLIVSFRSRFFIRIACAEVPALLGFVGSFLVYSVWPYAAGFGIAAIGFARLAPTRRNIWRDQERLNSLGCYRSLNRALRFLSTEPPQGPAA